MGEEEIIATLSHYSKIKEKFGESWILKNPEHPIYLHLKNSEVSFNEIDKLFDNCKKSKKGAEMLVNILKIEKKVKHQAYLNHLNKCLMVLEQYINKKTIQDLKNLPQFYKTISELELAEIFYREGYTDLELNPNIGNGKLDLKIRLDKRDIFFEVTTPDVYPGLDGKNYAQKVPDRAVDKFTEELTQCSNLFGKSPIVICINITESDITKDEVEDSVKEEIDEIFLDPKKGPINIGRVKAESQVMKEDKNSLFISGVMALERELTNKKYYFYHIVKGELYPISSSKLPLTNKEQDIINNILPKITSH